MFSKRPIEEQTDVKEVSYGDALQKNFDDNKIEYFCYVVINQ